VRLIRFRVGGGGPLTGVIGDGDGDGAGTSAITPLAAAPALSDLLALPLSRIREICANPGGEPVPADRAELLAPVDGRTEVWAAGVTYERSRTARMTESENSADIYDGEVVGYTICNDMSSRSIEGQNPLYLPQAKIYLGGCAVGPWIRPAWEVPDPYALTIELAIGRGGSVVWEGKTSTSGLRRRIDELAAYLFREDDFPAGAVLATGTSLVPDLPFTLEAGDEVRIAITEIGELVNPVVRGKAAMSKHERFSRISLQEPPPGSRSLHLPRPLFRLCTAPDHANRIYLYKFWSGAVQSRVPPQLSGNPSRGEPATGAKTEESSASLVRETSALTGPAGRE
jgi:2-dehydro-3-deoxy-D-arabinonate dehydratase